MRKWFLSILVLLLAAGTPLWSIPQGGPDPGFGDLVDPMALALYLDLSEEQVASALALHGVMREASVPIHEEIRHLESQLEEILAEGNPSTDEVGEIVISIHENRGALRAIHQEFETDFVALLSAEQADRYENLLEVLRVVRWSLAHDGPSPPPPGGGDGDHPSGP